MGVDAGAKLLLMDFCGEMPALALCTGLIVSADMRLRTRSAAAEWLPAIKELLQGCGWRLEDLSGVGVVSGPGSFTGIRVSLAAAKGLCEAHSWPLAAASRLAVLAAADGREGIVATLAAGRGQVYAGFIAEGGAWTERLVDFAQLPELATGRSVVTAEAGLAELLRDLHPTLLELGPAAILPLVHAKLSQGGADLSTTDANYVRSEADIYRKADRADVTAPSGVA